MHRQKLEKLTAAKSKISDAEVLLKEALQEVKAAPRAEKITLNEALRSAFANLEQAKEALTELEELFTEP